MDLARTRPSLASAAAQVCGAAAILFGDLAQYDRDRTHSRCRRRAVVT